jgi:hypothetical protein
MEEKSLLFKGLRLNDRPDFPSASAPVQHSPVEDAHFPHVAVRSPVPALRLTVVAPSKRRLRVGRERASLLSLVRKRRSLFLVSACAWRCNCALVYVRESEGRCGESWGRDRVGKKRKKPCARGSLVPCSRFHSLCSSMSLFSMSCSCASASLRLSSTFVELSRISTLVSRNANETRCGTRRRQSENDATANYHTSLQFGCCQRAHTQKVSGGYPKTETRIKLENTNLSPRAACAPADAACAPRPCTYIFIRHAYFYGSPQLMMLLFKVLQMIQVAELSMQRG